MRRVIFASLSYFGIVFAVGFALGIVRVLLLVPSMGEQAAELLELPVMTLLCFFSARIVVQKLSIIDIRSASVVGTVSLLLLLMAEFTVVLTVREMSLVNYLHARNSLAGYAYAVSLALYAIFPALIIYRRNHDK